METVFEKILSKAKELSNSDFNTYKSELLKELNTLSDPDYIKICTEKKGEIIYFLFEYISKIIRDDANSDWMDEYMKNYPL